MKRKFLSALLCLSLTALILPASFSYASGVPSVSQPGPASTPENADNKISGGTNLVIPYFLIEKSPFEYTDFKVLKNEVKGLESPETTEEYEKSADKSVYKDYLMRINIKSFPVTDPLKFSEKSGFDLFSAESYLTAGLPPTVFSKFTGNFDSEKLTGILKENGYTKDASVEGDTSLYLYEGSLDKGMNVELEKADKNFLFGGEMGQHFPIAFNNSQIFYSTAGGAFKNAVVNSLKPQEGNDYPKTLAEILSVISGIGEDKLYRMKYEPYFPPMKSAVPSAPQAYKYLIVSEYLEGQNDGKTLVTDLIVLETDSSERAEELKKGFEENYGNGKETDVPLLSTLKKAFEAVPEDFKVTETNGKHYVSFRLTHTFTYETGSLTLPMDSIIKSIMRRDTEWLTPEK